MYIPKIEIFGHCVSIHTYLVSEQVYMGTFFFKMKKSDGAPCSNGVSKPFTSHWPDEIGFFLDNSTYLA